MRMIVDRDLPLVGYRAAFARSAGRTTNTYTVAAPHAQSAITPVMDCAERPSKNADTNALAVHVD